MSARPYGPSHPRYREDLLPPDTIDWTQVYTVNGVYRSTDAETWKMPVSGTTMLDVVVDRFHERQANGEIIVNPMARTQNLWSYTVTSADYIIMLGSNEHRWSNQNWIDFFHGDHDVDPPVLPDWKIAAAKDEAITRAYSKAYSSDADLLIDLTQMKQTVEMFKTAAKRAASLVRGLTGILQLSELTPAQRRRKVAAMGQGLHVPLDSLAGWWCELRFGWGPLLSTLDGIAAALGKSQEEGRVERLTYRATEYINFNESAQKEQVIHPSTGTTWVRTHTVSTERKLSFRAGVIIDVKHSLQTNLGLEWSAVPIAIWDLVPWSFIVDRFLNLGNFIRSKFPKQGTTVAGPGWIVIRDEGVTTFRSRHHGTSSVGPDSVAIQPETENGITHRWSYVTRERVESPPSMPVIRHDWASITSLLNSIDGVMLAIQLLAPKMR